MSVEGSSFGSVALMAATRDLTAPLVLLRQLSFQLDSQLSEIDQPATAQALSQLRLTVDRTFAIADQLRLAISTADSLSLEPVQLTGLCRDVEREMAPLGRELHCELDFELPRRRDVVAVGNYQALKTILMGFIADALHYSSSGNQTKRSRLVRARVHLPRNGQVSLIIQDNGPSINLTRALSATQDPAVINPVEERPLMGSLNLLLADRLVRAMNGRLTVHNGRRGGAAIETTLPISQQLSLLGRLDG